MLQFLTCTEAKIECCTHFSFLLLTISFLSPVVLGVMFFIIVTWGNIDFSALYFRRMVNELNPWFGYVACLHLFDCK